MSNSSSSVGNALALLRLLQERDLLRVSDAASELGVARSTAHRLLASLKEHGFAVQDGDRSYVLDPRQRLGHGMLTAETLVPIARPHLEWLVSRTDETAHLIAPEGRMVRVIDSIEGSQGLRVGSRVGVLLPAHVAAAGLLFLGALSPQELAAIYTDGPPPGSGAQTIAEFHASLQGNRPYAISFGQAERGVNSLAMLVTDHNKRRVAAVALSAPAFRMPPQGMPEAATLVKECIQRIQASIPDRT
jgi:IclR family acetate operon transcriptional repressor